MKKFHSYLLGLALCVLAVAPFAASADTFECSCYFVMTAGSCTNDNDIAARASGVTMDSSSRPPDSSDANPTDPQLAKCKTDGCPDPGSTTFCHLGWIPKATVDGVKDGTLKVIDNQVVTLDRNCPPNTPPGKVCLPNALNVTSVPELVGNILKAGIGIVGALALLIFIYGGLRWLTSAGEPAKIQAGKDAMKWAAIGLVVIFSSYALVNFVLGSVKG